jgi:DNA-directed RNA polymerase sigma subunit (sigma70/sigma32)
LHELLRDVWTHQGWTDTPDMSNEYISRSTKPSEGGNRIALLSDIAAGLDRLNKTDKDLLRMRYANGGMEFGALGETYGTTEEAMRKRVKRALNKLQDRLGGEAPVWRGRRRVRSNAESRAEIRNQEEQE